MTTFGARLYAIAWFATAAVSVGIGLTGTAGTYEIYLEQTGPRLVEARRAWAETAVLPMGTVLPGPPTAGDPPPARSTPLSAADSNARIVSDRQWFVNVEYQKTRGYPPSADNKALIASYERNTPFNPDLSVPTAIAAGVAGLAALAASMPILLLALLRWLASGKWRFGFRLAD